MRRTYLELVGVQVTHNKRFNTYQVNNVYIRRVGNAYKGLATMKGFDMTRKIPFHTIATSLMDVYGSVIKWVWRQDNRRFESYYLQFVPSFNPGKVGLPGKWPLWAEW